MDWRAHYAYWHTPHLYQPVSGESFYDVQNRAIPEIHSIIDGHPGQTVLIVTHTIPLKLIMAHFEGREFGGDASFFSLKGKKSIAKNLYSYLLKK